MVTRGAENRLDPTGTPQQNEPSLGVLFTEMTEQVSVLLRREVELARVETQETAITLIVGGLILMAGRRAMEEVNLVPEKTIQSVQNNVDMIKEKVQ